MRVGTAIAFVVGLTILSGKWAAAADPPAVKDPADRAKIEQAIPARAFAAPAKARKLLIFDLNVNYGGHGSIAHANYAFTLMGEKTGAYQTVISRDPAVFRPESLKQFDAVFLNNTVGNLFVDPDLRRSLVEFVYSGGGLLGVHGTTVAFMQWPGAKEDWPEFGIMLGGRGANHRNSDEHVFMKLDDPEHPLNSVFDRNGFDYRDEFFRVHETYSRNRVRVLQSIDTAKTDMNQTFPRGNCVRADNDYATAWVRGYGRGRVFYCTIAHNPYVFSDPLMLKFYLGAIQFALGDLPAPTLPSAKLNAATRAQERLGWRPALEASAFRKLTFFQAIDKASELGLSYIGGLAAQQISSDIAKPFSAGLWDDEMRQIRLKLDAAAVRLLSYAVDQMPADETACRSLFDFARKMGVEVIIAAPSPQSLDRIEKLCDKYDIKLALRGGTPAEIMKLCDMRSPRIGACADVEHYVRNGIDPVEAIRLLKGRVIALQQLGYAGGNVPWGNTASHVVRMLRELRAANAAPAVMGLACSPAPGAMAETTRCVEVINVLSVEMSK